MNVLFIGGTGVISTSCTEYAKNKDIHLYHFNRGTKSTEGVVNIVGDISTGEGTHELKHIYFDAVVNFIGYKKSHVEADYQMFKDNVGQYVFISSASAYQKPVVSLPINESTPLKNPFWEYSRNKIECEDYLTQMYRDHDFPITIVRPTHTYNQTKVPVAISSNKTAWTIVDRIRKGKPLLVHGDGKSLWTITHADDFAVGLVGLLGSSKAIGNSYNIMGDEALNWDNITALTFKAAGCAPNIVHLTSEQISKEMPEQYGQLIGDKAESVLFDNSKIKSLVPEFGTRLMFEKGIKKSIDYLDAHPELQSIDNDYNDRIDALIQKFN